MVDEVKTIRIVVDASRAVDGSASATRALANIDKSTKDVDTTLQRMEKSLASMGSAIKAHLAIALADLVARLVETVKSAIAAVSGLDELAEQVGTTARALQGMQFAAVQNGASLEQLEQGINKFSIKMGEAAAGSKPVIDALTQLGVKNLDLQGNLRPTEELLADVATALLAIEDPAKRSAAAVDLFGKAGNKLLPSLKDFQLGADALVVLAKAQNAYVSPETIKRLDEYADRLERQKLQMRALAAEGVVLVLEKLDELDAWLSKNSMAFGDWVRSIDLTPMLDGIRNTMDEAVIAVGRVVVTIIEYFKQLPSEIPKLFVDAMNGAIKALESGLNTITGGLADSWLGRQLGISGGGVSLGRLEGGGAGTAGDRFGNARFAGSEWAAGQRQRNQEVYAQQQAERDRARQASEEQKALDNVHRFWLSESSATGYTPGAPGAGTSRPTGGGGGGGESPEQKLAKLEQQLRNTAEAQNAMTAAARAGDQAFEEQKTSLDATQKLFDIFGVTLDKTDERFIRVRDRMREIAQGKAAESFNVATTELQKQNVVLEAQIRLRDELPEVQARELALIKSTQEAQKAGAALSAQDVENRRAAIEQNERLKTQAEELKKAEELWTEPLKQALRDIQSTAADAFDKLLENGKLSFEELQTTFMRIIRRMAAEFLALATIRPVMSVLVNAISPSMAQSMGLGGSSSMGGGLLGGSGGGGLFSPGWSSTPIFGGIDDEIAAWSAYGTSAQNAFSLSSMTWGQAAGIGGGLLGMGMGVNSLLSGGGSTGSIIGGAAGILGGGLGIAGALMPAVLGGALGPIGMAVGLLGGILPSLLGGSTPPVITNSTYAQLQYGSGGWGTSGGAWGPSANSSQSEAGLKALGGGISNVFGLLGGVKDPQKVWGLSAQSKSVSGQGWSSDSTSTFLVDPSGNQQLWRMNESNMMDTASAQVAYRSILEGAVGDITENMRKALIQTGQTMGGTSLQAIAETVSEVLAFDEAIKGLGKTVIDAEKAVKAVDDSFAAMYATADKYGLATGDLDASKAAARLGVATDFGKGISRSILEMTDPKAAAMQDIEDWRSMMVDNNKWLLDNVEGAMDQILKIEELFGLKRAAIIEQTTSNALGSLKNTLDRLLYGDLSGASPGDALSGAYGSYQADLAKANLGDAAAAGRLNSSSGDYMSAAASYYGTSSAAYQTLRRQTIIDVAGAYRYNGGSFGDIPGAYDVIMGGGGFTGLPGMGAGSLNIGLATVSQQFGDLSAKFVQVLDSSATRDEKIDELLDLMRRLVMGNAG